MSRWKLPAAMVSLTAMLAAVIVLCSPYFPVVGGAMEIEALWAIEDTRQESEKPLVTALENNGVPLGYDEQSNTFYCNLGLENGEEWPQLHLTAPGAKGVELCFVDDYTYDFCSDAIAQGYAYELFAYTDAEYSYFNIVFTGLPTVSLYTQDEVALNEQAGHVQIGGVDAGLDCEGMIRLRGDASLIESQKVGYRVSFACGRREGGQNVPGMGVMKKFNLIALAFDDTQMHDKLSWDVYDLITPKEAAFSGRRTQYVELFVNNEYVGLYLMQEPFDYQKEIAKSASAAPLTDSLYRTAVIERVRDNAVLEWEMGTGYELFYAADSADPFEPLKDFITVREQEDDALFETQVLEWIDMESLMRYVVMLQAGGMVDNVQNNMFIWAHYENGKRVYRFIPWDMDRTWGMNAGEDNEHWSVCPIADRMLNLNVGGSREILLRVWRQLKEKAYNLETVTGLIRSYEHQLNDSGAMRRNAERWGGASPMADGYEILAFCEMRFDLFERVLMQMNESDAPISFLSDDEYWDWNVYVKMRID